MTKPQSLFPNRFRASLVLLLPVCAMAVMASLSGCHAKSSEASPASGAASKAPSPPPAVSVQFVRPTVEPVAPFEEFGGRTSSPATVELRARVSGYLTKVHFQDGADVKAGDVLFEIDDSTYAAVLEQAEATVLERDAELKRVRLHLDRAKRLLTSQASTELEVENLTYDVARALAGRVAAEAVRDRAKLDVAFTRVTAPLSGKIGRRLVDPGNLVQADQTPLAVVVSLDPMFAYFDYDERSVLVMRRLVEEGKLKAAPDRDLPVHLALAGENEYNLTGTLDWVDNQIDMGTGTLRARASVANPTGLLSPGMFVRLRVPLGPEADALLIPEEALGADQGQRYVYTINDNDEIEYRRVEVGWLTGGKRVITSGLTANDRVVVTGLQRVRPSTKVAPREWSAASPAE
ncbi:efflux RND transporter periplasmic adaptor subunit [Planctomicrobium sp. SH661]|uniref:efflux RND transporter periplasmic adaptor subunit n=1 Tax=Planctomicrobium sp. SH661 TaxID=3448124 RepID=UPI003F5AEBA5